MNPNEWIVQPILLYEPSIQSVKAKNGANERECGVEYDLKMNQNGTQLHKFNAYISAKFTCSA